jgi:hypothetical protein
MGQAQEASKVFTLANSARRRHVCFGMFSAGGAFLRKATGWARCTVGIQMRPDAASAVQTIWSAARDRRFGIFFFLMGSNQKYQSGDPSPHSKTVSAKHAGPLCH